MKYLKSIREKINVKTLPHSGNSLEKGKNISIFEQDWFEKLMPDSLDIYSSPLIKKLNHDQSIKNIKSKIISLKKNFCCINNDLIQFGYSQDKDIDPNNINDDGEPDGLSFDIYFVRNESGIKMNIDITYGDNMVYEFTLESPNKINIVHYTGKGSLYDPDTHWGFTEESIQKLVDFFNRFNHGIKLSTDDLNFLDSNENSYQHDNKNTKHIYSDDSNLIKFGNSVKESYGSNIFLIINNAKSPEYKYFPKVAKYLRLRNIPYKVATTSEDVIKYNSEYNIIGSLSTGSDFSMKSPSSSSEYKTSETALNILRCPILAMCYGFQSMAKFYGQNINGGELNCNLFNLTDYDQSHFLFNGVDLTQQKLSFCFHDYPVNVHNGFENIAMLGDTIAGISNQSLQRYGILFHPEELQETYIILDNFINHCENLIKKVESKIGVVESYDQFVKRIKKY